ncbi:MAG: HAD family hydrolase [Candidatus Gracilibacteria bacterium]|jgi:D-glycero-D-manno-heptose 1,7-bisphosphate phosphatase
MKNRAVFLDRDGVINKDKDHVYKIEDIEFYNDVFLALRRLPLYLKKIIVTNQAGIAKGLYAEKDYNVLTEWMIKRFENHNIKIDNVYFCPHHPEGVIKKYKKVCKCRKPNIGMFKKAEKDFNLDLKKCWLIGDKLSDILAGKKAGCKTILVLTGQDSCNKKALVEADFCTKTLMEAVEFICSKKCDLF